MPPPLAWGKRSFVSLRASCSAFPRAKTTCCWTRHPTCYLYAIGVTPGLSAEVLRRDLHRVALPLRARLSSLELHHLSARARAITDRHGVDASGAELWEHAHSLGRKYLAGEPTMHVLTRRAMAELCDEPGLALAQLASRLRADASDISRYFHRDLGMTFVAYRSRLRLLRFIALADESSVNLLTAAVAAGFGSYSQCHRVFQAELGCGPRQFLLGGQRQRMQLAYEG